MLPFCTKNWSSLTSPASNISPGNFLYLWIKVEKVILSDYPIISLELPPPGTTSWKAVGISCWALTRNKKSVKLNEAKKENSIKSLTPFLSNYYNPFLFHLFFLLPDKMNPVSVFHILILFSHSLLLNMKQKNLKLGLWYTFWDLWLQPGTEILSLAFSFSSAHQPMHV